MAKIPQIVTALVFSVMLVGCVGHRTVMLMPRDSGKIYTGTMEGANGMGTMSVTIEGVIFTGPVVVTQSNETFGFYQSFGAGGLRSGFVAGQSGSAYLKALLASPDGRGLRCDLIGSGGGKGSAICVDDKGRVFDAIITPK